MLLNPLRVQYPPSISVKLKPPVPERPGRNAPNGTSTVGFIA